MTNLPGTRGPTAANAPDTTTQAALTQLRRERQELQATVAALSTRVDQLSTEIATLRNSTSWRVSAPLRHLSGPARAVRRLLLVPIRFARHAGSPGYAPLHDVERRADGTFVTTGDQPQLQILTGWRSLRPGWARFDIALRTDAPELMPTLLAFADTAGTPVARYPVFSREGAPARRLIQIPAGTRSLRLDLAGGNGTPFSVERLSVHNIGKLGLVREGLASLNAEQRGAVLRALLRGRLGAAKALLGAGVAHEHGHAEYQAWVERYDTPNDAELAVMTRLGRHLPRRALISILMPVYNPRPRYLRKALDSVLAQTYENWELCIADDASSDAEVRAVLEEYRDRDSRIKLTFRQTNGHICASSNTALELVSGEFVALMDHDDALPPHALYLIANEIDRFPNVDLIYTDEDKVDENDLRHDPHFKTDWNRELFYSQNFVAHLGVYRATLLRRIGGFRTGFEGSQDYDLVLRFLPHTDASRIRHIPHVLYHWRIFPGVASFSTDNPDASIDTARRALVEYFETAEPGARVVGIDRFPSWWRIKRPPPRTLPRVSLIIPTRDRVELLKNCVQGLLHATDYADLEIIIVDNESVEEATHVYFRSLATHANVRIMRVAGPFNFSILNNRAVDAATGQVIGFVNNDIDVIHADWLMELVTQLDRPNVGAVGAKLYYANDTIQHAGVILGLYGVAAHGHRHFPRGSVGYFGRPLLVQNLSAVTAACMLVRKSVFEAVGGYDEANLAVGYNDVDLCLKIREAGHDIVFTPFAELYHLESVSRGANVSAAQIERDSRERAHMLRRWPSVIAHDPFYNPNLTVGSENFALAFPPRAPKPWREE
ncbi:MAG: glycosyltransferase family 2 protein [Janthinobacterium lividum]